MGELTKSTVKTASTGKKISRGLVDYHLHNTGGDRVRSLSELRREEKAKIREEKDVTGNG